MFIGDLLIFLYLGKIVDVFLVWFVIYKLIMVIRGIKVVQFLKGIMVILVVCFISNFFGLNML